MRLASAAAALAVAMAFAIPANARAIHCSTVTGRYSIYANGDFLHVDKSRHLLVVVIDELDKKLERAGWQHSSAEGQFTICYSRPVPPLDLTIRDEVRVKGYSEIRVVSR